MRNAQVNRHIEHSPMRHSNQFSLRALDLVVHSTYHPLTGLAVVVLHEFHIQAGRFLKVSLIEAFEEKASVITDDLRLKNQHLGKIGFRHCIGHSSTQFSRLTRYWP